MHTAPSATTPAASIAEMAGIPRSVSACTDTLDSTGNTTAAIGLTALV
jgi:H+-translocating diphosphatase